MHNRVKKETNWESCILNVDHIPKWYMHEPESVQKNEMHRIILILGYKLITQPWPEDQTEC